MDKILEDNIIEKKATEMYFKMYDEFLTGIENTCKNIYRTMYNPNIPIVKLGVIEKEHRVFSQILERARKERKVPIDLIRFKHNTQQQLCKLKHETTEKIINKLLPYIGIRIDYERLRTFSRLIADILEKEIY